MTVRFPKCNQTIRECLKCSYTDVCDREPSWEELRISDELNKEAKQGKGHSPPEYLSEWRKNHREHVQEYFRNYRAQHKEELCEYQKEWWNEHKAMKRRYDKEYYTRNREKILSRQREQYKAQKAKAV